MLVTFLEKATQKNLSNIIWASPFLSFIITSASAFLLFYLFADLKDQLHVTLFANLAKRGMEEKNTSQERKVKLEDRNKLSSTALLLTIKFTKNEL